MREEIEMTSDVPTPEELRSMAPPPPPPSPASQRPSWRERRAAERVEQQRTEAARQAYVNEMQNNARRFVEDYGDALRGAASRGETFMSVEATEELAPYVAGIYNSMGYSATYRNEPSSVYITPDEPTDYDHWKVIVDWKRT